jgi:two-component system, sensor histidine kinase and response regulator
LTTPCDVTGSVLVVDDNPLIIGILKSVLASRHYEVHACENGQDALDLLQTKSVDVIICDVMMPKMDGYTLHFNIRQNPALTHVPFIFLTALDQPHEIETGTESGVDDYVTKPFDPQQLLAVVKGKLVRSRALKDSVSERLDTFRKRVVHTLSHELRTPLVAINTGAELLLEQRDELGGAKTKHLLEAIRRGGMRLEKMVNDFMVLQQIEAGIARRSFDVYAEKVPVQTLLNTFLETRRSQSDAAAFRIECDYEESCRLVEVSAHIPQAHEMLERIVHNAIKFSHSEMVIAVSVTREGSEVRISIADRGRGMDVSRVREALQAFGQLDREKLEQQGGGLGLPIAAGYAAIMGGRLEFETREAGGTIVTVVLPIARG